MAPVCARAGVPFFANDRPDLAILARCDGVHLGRDDVPAQLARRLALAGAPPSPTPLRVGLSTHNAADVDEALAEGPDYIAVGPVFPTVSKDRPSPVVGLGRLAELAAQVRRARPELPVVAIGGVTLENAADVGAIADCAAVIGALLPPSSSDALGPAFFHAVAERARALSAAVLGAKR